MKQVDTNLTSSSKRAAIELVPVTPWSTVQAARRAWRRFGKGNHPARLNFGDCFAYALAEVTGEPLLIQGRGLRAHGFIVCVVADS